MASCLRPEQITEFRKALKDKEIKMEDLLNMPTEKLIETFVPYAGEKNAKDIALLFEQKRVLKNKEIGIRNAVSKLGEIGRYDPKKKAAIAESVAQFREMQQERIFNPKAGETFYNALADKIVGAHITRAEAQTMFDIQAKSDAIKEANFDHMKEEWANPKAQFEYGMQQAYLKAFTGDLKGDSAPLKEMLKGRYEEFKQQYRENKPMAVASILGDTMAQVRDTSVALLASFLDNSFQLRQGFSSLINKPDVWKKGFVNSWVDIGKSLKGKYAEAKLALDAEIFSDPDYIMGRMHGLLKGETEEQFPTSLPARIPGVGRLFKAADIAFTGSALRNRVGLFKNFLDIQELAGADRSDPEVIRGAEQLALQMTARAKAGKMLNSPVTRVVLWAPRMLQSSWDNLTVPLKPSTSPFVRKEAAMNLLRYVAVMGTMKAVASAMIPGSVTVDPRATKSKDIVIGNTHFSFGIGEQALITLASRLVPTMHNGEWGFWTVNSEGIYKKFDGGSYGGRSPFDIAVDFLQGKAHPFPTRILLDYLNQRTFSGKKPTAANEAAGLVTPINLQNTIQLADDSSVQAVLGVISEGLGASANTYSTKADWGQSSSKEMEQFKAKIGDDRFQAANDLFNQRFSTWLESTKQKPAYTKLSEEEKSAVLAQKKDEIKSQIFRQNSFIYRPEKKKQTPRL